MSNIEPLIGIFHDVITGEIVTRELTAEEIAALPEPASKLEGES
jgi:hypothetical protein